MRIFYEKIIIGIVSVTCFPKRKAGSFFTLLPSITVKNEIFYEFLDQGVVKQLLSLRTSEEDFRATLHMHEKFMKILPDDLKNGLSYSEQVRGHFFSRSLTTE